MRREERKEGKEGEEKRKTNMERGRKEGKDGAVGLGGWEQRPCGEQSILSCCAEHRAGWANPALSRDEETESQGDEGACARLLCE